MYKKAEIISKIVASLRKGSLLLTAISESGLKSPRTLFRWRNEDPRIDTLIRTAQELANKERVKTVEDALYKRATGECEVYEDVINKETGKVVRLYKKLPPDTMAMMYFLNNNASDRYKNRQDPINVNATLTLESLLKEVNEFESKRSRIATGAN